MSTKTSLLRRFFFARDPMYLVQELALAQQLAREAGKIALSRKNVLKVRFKPEEQGPVSDVDIELNDFICQEIKNKFPQDQIIGEESYQGEDIATKGRVWLIDPIDGTGSYILGQEDYVVMIGLMIDAEPVLGAIYHPPSDTLWSGVSYKTNRLSLKEHLGQSHELCVGHNHVECPRVLVSKTSKSKRQALFLECLQPAEIIKKNSIGLKAMLVLEQQADLYVCFSRHMKLWDTCAAVAIVDAAGSKAMHCDTSMLHFDRGISHNNFLMVMNYSPSKEFLTMLHKVLYC